MYSIKNKLVNLNDFTQLQQQLGNLLYTCHEIQLDSRQVIENDIFCAYPGVSVDGRNFIPLVASNSPCAIIYDLPYECHVYAVSFGIQNLQQYVGMLAAYKYDTPSAKLLTIGVTGTNGKTSISHWLNQAFNQLEYTTAIIGTTGCGIYPDVVDLSATTPDPATLQKLFNRFYQSKVDLVAIEVSSHALHQGRVNGLVFDSAIFTNLTQDHLDYHGTMDEYFNAKKQLFFWHNLKYAIINIDDAYGQQLLDNLNSNNSASLQIITYAIDCHADLQASNIRLMLSGLVFDLHYQSKVIQIKTKVIGLFNVYNLLAVFASLVSHGVKLKQLPEIALNLTPVVGRMDALIYPNKPLVVIDYAHTPDALEKALTTLNEIEHRKLFCVFGCGGNRDKSKRSIMGEIAINKADYSYVTSDNPRFENPQDIINEITQGMSGKQNYEIVVNRHDAIIKALTMATAKDIVLIAGKGHETYQEIEGIKHYFNDAQLVKEFYQTN